MRIIVGISYSYTIQQLTISNVIIQWNFREYNLIIRVYHLKLYIYIDCGT